MEKIAVISNTRSIIGESPQWDSRINRLVYVDIFDGVVSRLDPETRREERVRFKGDYVSLAVPTATDPDKLIISRNNQLCCYDYQSRETSVLAEVEPGAHTRFNDGKCDIKGRLWAGTMSLETAPGVFADDLANLYSMDSSKNIMVHKSGLRISNGLAWDGQNRKMFFIDSLPRKIYVFDYNAEKGTISNEKTLIDFNTNPWYSDCGLPDGMTIDENDKLWVACFNGGCVLNIDPTTGAILKRLNFPASKITSCCFGGPEYNILYVTSGSKDLSENERLAERDPGVVFQVTGLGTKGLQPNYFDA